MRTAFRDLDEAEEAKAKAEAAVIAAKKRVEALLGEKVPSPKPPNRANGSAKPTAKKPAQNGASKVDAIFAQIRENPGIANPELATRVYGTLDAGTKHKVRSLTYYLEKRQKIRKKGDGWEATTN